MSEPIVIPVRSAAVRWLIAGIAIAASITIAVVCGRWAIAETILYFARQTPVPSSALVVARSYAPSDPQTALGLGRYYMDVANPPDLEAAGRLLDEAAAGSPSSTRVWLAVGRHREQTGRGDEAERAYLRASEIAPYHWEPRFALGNLYVRQGRTDEAEPQLRRVVELNPSLAPLTIRTMWAASQGDVAAVSRVVGDSTAGRSALIALLLGEKRLDEAARLWREAAGGGSPGSELDERGRALAGALLAAGRAEEFAAVWERLDPDHPPTLDTVSDSGFEGGWSGAPATGPFSWSITQAPDARVTAGEGRTGGRALRIDYNAKGAASFVHAEQTVRVQPGARLALEFWAATDDLQTGGAPAVTVVDAADRGRQLAVRQLPTGTTAWSAYRSELTAPASGLVVVRVARAGCGEVCPIFGAATFDEVRLVR